MSIVTLNIDRNRRNIVSTVNGQMPDLDGDVNVKSGVQSIGITGGGNTTVVPGGTTANPTFLISSTGGGGGGGGNVTKLESPFSLSGTTNQASGLIDTLPDLLYPFGGSFTITNATSHNNGDLVLDFKGRYVGTYWLFTMLLGEETRAFNSITISGLYCGTIYVTAYCRDLMIEASSSDFYILGSVTHRIEIGTTSAQVQMLANLSTIQGERNLSVYGGSTLAIQGLMPADISSTSYDRMFFADEGSSIFAPNIVGMSYEKCGGNGVVIANQWPSGTLKQYYPTMA